MENTLKGRIIGSNSGYFNVRTDCGDVITCRPRGHFRHDGIKLLAGDRVNVSHDGNDTYVIDSIDERKNKLIRPPLANIDILFCVASLISPKVDPLTFDKLITTAEHNNIEPVIIVTKADGDDAASETFADIYRKCGFEVFVTSSVNGKGIEELREYIKAHSNSVFAFSGASGVGKSSIVNTLFPRLSLEVGALSRKTERGRQTTRQSTLYELSKICDDIEGTGFIADTPGFSMLDFVNFDFYSPEELPFLFREFREHIGTCKYTKCRHLKEEGCSVIEDVKKGNIPQSRHKNYCLIYEEIKDKRPWDQKKQ